jgi:DNA-binding response OmpR family regulator/DNA-binding CsgD family transcriptional regulator
MSKHHILIVDDNPYSVSLVSAVLSPKIDCEFSVAFDGPSAIKKARETIPDLILMDWQMPGIDGLRSIELLKEDLITAQIPVIMITCFSEKSDLEKAFNAGVVDYIQKPFDSVEMRARVRSVLQTNAYYRQMIDSQKRELAAMSLRNTQNEAFRSKSISELRQLQTLLKSEPSVVAAHIDRIINELNTDLSDRSWSQFENRIKESDQEFYRNLGTKHPNLTPAEIKLCFLLRLNLSTKEIAGMTFQTYDSVRVSRTRLRKKMNLSIDENLVGYLFSL